MSEKALVESISDSGSQSEKSDNTLITNQKKRKFLSYSELTTQIHVNSTSYKSRRHELNEKHNKMKQHLHLLEKQYIREFIQDEFLLNSESNNMTIWVSSKIHNHTDIIQDLQKNGYKIGTDIAMNGNVWIRYIGTHINNITYTMTTTIINSS